MAKYSEGKKLSNEEIEAIAGEFSQKLEILRVRYEQYFGGTEKVAPSVLRMEVVRLMRTLEQAQVKNTALKFKIRTSIQKFTSYSTYWNRVLREIEDGTYKRHIDKAKRNQAQKEREEQAKQQTGRSHAASDAPKSEAAQSASAEAEAFLESLGLSGPARAVSRTVQTDSVQTTGRRRRPTIVQSAVSNPAVEPAQTHVPGDSMPLPQGISQTSVRSSGSPAIHQPSAVHPSIVRPAIHRPSGIHGAVAQTPAAPQQSGIHAPAVRPAAVRPSGPAIHQPSGMHAAVPNPVQPGNGAPVRPTVPGAVRPTVPGAVRPEVPGAVRPTVPGAVRPTVPGAVRPEVPGAVRPEVPGAVRPAVPGAVHPSGANPPLPHHPAHAPVVPHLPPRPGVQAPQANPGSNSGEYRNPLLPSMPRGPHRS